MRSLALSLVALVLAGCAAPTPPGGPALPPPSSTHIPFEWEGFLMPRAGVCASATGCAIAQPIERSQATSLPFNETPAEIDLEMTWTAETPATEQLTLVIYFGDDAVEWTQVTGGSPLTLTKTITAATLPSPMHVFVTAQARANDVDVVHESRQTFTVVGEIVARTPE